MINNLVNNAEYKLNNDYDDDYKEYKTVKHGEEFVAYYEDGTLQAYYNDNYDNIYDIEKIMYRLNGQIDIIRMNTNVILSSRGGIKYKNKLALLRIVFDQVKNGQIYHTCYIGADGIDKNKKKIGDPNGYYYDANGNLSAKIYWSDEVGSILIEHFKDDIMINSEYTFNGNERNLIAYYR